MSYNTTGVLDVWLLVYRSLRIYIKTLTYRANIYVRQMEENSTDSYSVSSK